MECDENIYLKKKFFIFIYFHPSILHTGYLFI